MVLENFRPGVMKRLGLGWEALHARNPRLVLGSISGFGQTGPYASRGGFDLMVQAMSGLMSVTGPKDGPPYRIPLAISDVGAGLYLTIGVLAALQARQKTGEGQWVETSLLEATVSLGVYEAANYFANGMRPEKLGQAHRGSSPYQVFQTVRRLAHHRRRAAEFLPQALRHDRQARARRRSALQDQCRARQEQRR